MVSRSEIVGLALLGFALFSNRGGDSFILSAPNFMRQTPAQNDILETSVPLRIKKIKPKKKIFTQADLTRRTSGGAFQLQQRNQLLKLGFTGPEALFVINKARNQGLPLQTFINQAQNQSL